MEFLTTAVKAPMDNFGPLGFMAAIVAWVVLLYMGYRYSVASRKVRTAGYMSACVISIVMVAGLMMMVTTNLFDDKNSVLTATYAVIAFVTFGSLGGFIGVMAASCGFIFGASIRLINHISYR